MKAVIALGANLGDPRKQISIAIDEIREIIEITARLYMKLPQSEFQITNRIT
jgi:7,8-dihydro-6-hydroxymethylpterin-pyrophosphokinase